MATSSTTPKTEPNLWTAAEFARPPLTVARELLGMHLIHDSADGRCVGRIVETEGYTQDDPAFQGWRVLDPDTGQLRTTGRGAIFYGAPGSAYIYRSWGHWLLNIITQPEGQAGAVLIRAVEPMAGLEHIAQRRPKARCPIGQTNGPGRLTEAFGLTGQLTGHRMIQLPLAIGRPATLAELPTIANSPRIGLRYGTHLPRRFLFKDNPYCSPARPG
ncbi:MAG: DNA-3-methyladenine glycosylase [Myxococcota bacterium]